MTEIERREDPTEPIDETTEDRRKASLRRVETAEIGAQRTRDAVSTLRGFSEEIRVMHERNHYVDKLVLIYRGTPRHA